MKKAFGFLLCVYLIPMIFGGVVFSKPHADRAVRFFENLKHTKGKFHGQPFILLPWEKRIVRDVYGTLNEDGTRQYKYIYTEEPKKNGKSEIGAGAALYHLYADGEWSGEVYGCAGERKQAGIIFDVAAEMVLQVPALVKRSKITGTAAGGTKVIKDLISKSKYEVLSAEAFSKHGYNPSCVIFDELHVQPNRSLWDVMTSQSGDAREQPIWWIFTTAGDDPDRVSICWEIHEKALKILSGEIIDPTWYVTIFNYEGDDIYNEKNWYKANPSLGTTISLKAVREAAQKAKNDPADERLFRWLRLNQWITTKLTTWLPLKLFEDTVGKDWKWEDLAGRDCYIGKDLSSTTDLTALCAVFPPQGEQLDWRVIWDVFIPEENMRERIKTDKVPYDEWLKQGWITATPGNVVDYTVVLERIATWKSLYNIIEDASDRSMAAMLTQEEEKLGITCVDIPQTFASLTGPINLVETLLKKGEMTHEDNPAAKWCFGNTSIAKNGNAQVKFVKESRGKSVVRTKRIDTSVALVCAMARAQFYGGTVDISSKILSKDWGM